ncbi:hypothetical protein CSC2_18490 [Clostridium zeae]|uniref:DUF1700 domain-containing protein n=1 Tax=Clostridium zeae TaxID=2759022 RepID=A0ABQ1E9Z7_9CLOT|nr:permease prefix domain 1-containing protein [Clostridium zeae]GFZ31323.1 hypothetical protein CSC2_18490 [Clostridium zeae]
MNIESYVEKVYKNFDRNNEEVQVLKEEMKAHLYDSVRDLMSEGHSEKESIKIAIKNFGDEEVFTSELEEIVSRQKKYTNVLLKIAIVVFIIGVIVRISGIFTEEIYRADWEKNRPMTSSDLYNKIEEIGGEKEALTSEDKSKIDELLNKYNDTYDNGVYYIRVIKDGKVNYEYERKVDEKLITNQGQGEASNINGWKVEHRETDLDSYRCSQIYNEAFNIQNQTNELFYILKNIGFLFIALSWMIACISYTQSFILKGKEIKRLAFLLSLETIVIFASILSEKEIIIVVPLMFMALNKILFRVLENKENKLPLPQKAN